MAAYHAPPSTGFSRQEYWSGLPLPSPVRFNIQYENFGTGIQIQHDTWETVHALSPDLSSKLTPTLDNGKLVNKLIYVLQFIFLWNQRDFKTNLTGLLWIWASLVAQLVKNPPAMQETWVWSLVWEDQGFPGGLAGKVSTCNEGDLGSIPGSGRSPGEENGTPLQYSCLENPMDGGAWEAAVHGVVKSRTWLSEFTSLHFWEDLEKGKATHSSILAWRIPWTVHGVAKSRTQLSDFHFTLFHFTVNKFSAYIDWILFTTNGRNYLVHMDMFLNCVFLLFLNAYQNICTPFLNFVFPWSGNYKDGNCERIHL